MSLRVPPCATLPLDRMRSNYYQLLGISPNEPDARVIEEAALTCSAQFRVYLLNRLAQALNTLLDPVNRRTYDLGLRTSCDPASEIGVANERREKPVPAHQGARPPGSKEAPLLFSAACQVVTSSSSTANPPRDGPSRRAFLFRSILRPL